MTTRIPSKLPQEDLLIIGGTERSPLRPGGLSTTKIYHQLRAKQLQAALTQGDQAATNRMLSASESIIPAETWPVMLGQHGELIAIYMKRQLGSGSFGTVYLGINLETGVACAIKKQEVAKKDRSYETKMDMIYDEEEALQSLGDFVTKMEQNLDDVFISHVVETLAEGDKLHKFKQEPLEAKLDIAIKFLEAIHKMHGSGWVNRDIKLDNAIYDPIAKIVKLIDMGLAKHLNKDKNYLDSGQSVGTPHCIAPETFQSTDGHTVYNPQTDTYSGGISLLEFFSENSLCFSNHDFLQHAFAIYQSNFKPGLAPKIEEKLQKTQLMLDLEDPLQKELYDVILSLANINQNERADLPKAISELKAIQKRWQHQHEIPPISLEVSPASPSVSTKSMSAQSTASLSEDDSPVDDMVIQRPPVLQPNHIGFSMVDARLAENPYKLRIQSPGMAESLSRAASNDLISDIDIKATLDQITDNLQNFIQTLQAGNTNTRKSIVHSHHPNPRNMVLSDAHQLLRNIQSMMQKDPITHRHLLEFGFNLTKIQGDNIARGLDESNPHSVAVKDFNALLKQTETALGPILDKENKLSISESSGPSGIKFKW